MQVRCGLSLDKFSFPFKIDRKFVILAKFLGDLIETLIVLRKDISFGKVGRIIFIKLLQASAVFVLKVLKISGLIPSFFRSDLHHIATASRGTYRVIAVLCENIL